MMCISKTYRDFGLADDDPRLNLPGLNVVRAENPKNTERGCVL